VFVLPKPGEEDGSSGVEPVETAAAMPAPTDLDRPLEPEIGTASSLGAGDDTAAPAAERAETPAVPRREQDPQPVIEAPAPEMEQGTPRTATVVEVVESQPVVTASPDDTVQTETARSEAEPSPIPTAPITEPGLTTTAGGSAEVEQVTALPEAPAPTTGSAATERASIPAAPTTEGSAESAEDQLPRIYGVGNSNARIILRATQDSWVQVRDDEDSLLLTRLLRAGDSYRVPNRSGLTMLTGNAGGLEIEVDGTALGPLGPVGKVRRDVPLDADRLIKSHNLAQ